jgi:hypothetical protein
MKPSERAATETLVAAALTTKRPVAAAPRGLSLRTSAGVRRHAIGARATPASVESGSGGLTTRIRAAQLRHAWPALEHTPRSTRPVISSLAGGQLGAPLTSRPATWRPARLVRVGDVDHHAAAGLVTASRPSRSRLRSVPIVPSVCRNAPRRGHPQADAGYDEDLGERDRRDPVRAQVAARVTLRPAVAPGYSGT